MIRWCSPAMDDEMVEAAAHSLRTEKMIMGESVFKFEEEFARYCGVAKAISVSSGTNALFFVLSTLGMKGKRVATPASSFIASPNSILQAGGLPHFVDINNEYTMDCSLLRKNAGFDALLPVHLYGHPSRMDEVMEYAAQAGIPVIEDACQAHGASFAGKKCGSIGTAGCFSFYSTKNMTVGGDGGMITTNDLELAAAIEKLRNSGRKTFYEHDVLGYTSRLNSANAAIGRVQLRRLDSWNARRTAVAKKYHSLLKHSSIVLPPMGDSMAVPVFHLFSIKHPKRDLLKSFLKEKGIESGTNYPLSLPHQPLYSSMMPVKAGDFPKSEELSAQVLCLPMHPDLTDDEVRLVSEAILEFEAKNG